MTLFARTAACVLAGLALLAAPDLQAQEAELSAAEVRADLDELLAVVERTHPDLGYVADRDALQREAVTIRSEISRPMTVRETWLALARLNPFFTDAHTGVRHPASEFEAYREAGGIVFPLPVFVDRAGGLRVAGNVAKGSGVRPFDHVVAINGRSSKAIIAGLMPRMRGETESLRRLVLAFNFPAHLWTLEGPVDVYNVEVRGDDGRTRDLLLGPAPAQAGLPAAPSLTFPRPDVALLRVPSFDPALRDSFSAFLKQSIGKIEQAEAQTLLIDIRDNPGGAHEVSDQLVAWLTEAPVLPYSALTARITADNRDISPAASLRSVVTVPYDEPIAPRSDERRFGGDVYVLLSEDSYSQAIVFAATIRDHGLGKLVGEMTGGAANQTGQITLHPLGNSGLQALAPLYIIYRPSGDKARSGLVPDIPLPHDPVHPDAMIDRFLAGHHGSGLRSR